MDQLPGAQKPGLVARIVLGIAALGVVIVGFFFLTVALIAGALLALTVGARLWWTLRKFKRAMAEGADGTGRATASPMSGAPHRAGKDALDGEFQVIERESAASKLPPKD